jgi:hypothetical protein
VRNIWVVHFGMISCAAIIPLLFAHREIRKLATETDAAAPVVPRPDPATPGSASSLASPGRAG